MPDAQRAPLSVLSGCEVCFQLPVSRGRAQCRCLQVMLSLSGHCQTNAVFACFEKVKSGSQLAKTRSLQGLLSNCFPRLALGQVSAHPGVLRGPGISVCWQQHPQHELRAAVKLPKVPLQLALLGQPLRSRRDLHSVTASAFTPPPGRF